LRKVLILLITLVPVFAIAAEMPNQCSVTFVRGEETKVLGNFEAKLGEETETIKTFPIPGMKLLAKVSVYYTDESIRFDVPPRWMQDTSIQMLVAITDKDDDSVLKSSDASIGEAAIVTRTDEKNMLRVSKIGSTPEGKFGIVAECRSK
jgi:hypothetical protein